MHKFDVKDLKMLDNEERQKMLPAEKILLDIGLKAGDYIADIGCGTGFFSIPASKITGDKGIVFAADIMPEMIREVQKKIKNSDISNIKLILCSKNNFKLNEKVNIAFMCNVLHEIGNKESFISRVKNLILNKGKIAVVEWQKIESEIGPPIEHRLSKEDLKKILKDAGFFNILIKDIGINHLIITGELI